MAIRIPGIIVRIVNDTGNVAPAAYERFPVIIGTGDVYRVITNEKILRGTGSTDTLSAPTAVNAIASIGDLPGISKYVATTDYTLIGNTVSWAGAADAPTAGEYYYTTYTDTRAASAYTPTLYFDENLIYADHGNTIKSDGEINDVSVGGMLALNAGSNGVIIAQLDTRLAVDRENPTNSELEVEFTEVITALEKITDYKLLLVPMSSGTLDTTTAATILFNHAVVASQPENKQERTVIGALEKAQGYVAVATFAQSYAHERMVAPAVPNTTTQVGGIGVTDTYDMRFYNAALAGKLCSVGIGRTISDETIPGVTFDDNYSPAEANYLVQRGVSPAKISGDVARNIMAITTDTTSALTEDLGVQDTKDYVKKYWREGLWRIYKNSPITGALPGAIKQSSVSILDSLIDRSIVAEYKSLTATQDSSEPRRVNVTGKIKPAFGLQWMDITFTFVLSF